MKIDLSEKFPLLSRAPIAEAVVRIRARAEAPWEETAISRQLQAVLPDYPNIHSGAAFEQVVKMELGKTDAPPEQAVQDLGWHGLRCETADRRQIVQFERDGFQFSRLAPYQNWDRLQREALRLWRIHDQMAQSTEIYRVGLRFIHRMMGPRDGLRLEDYFQAAPQAPREIDLSCASFFHRSSFVVPGNSYGVVLVQTVQPPQGAKGAEVGLILDIDVLTTEPFAPEHAILEQRLAEMRWLKNKVFFGSITPKALEAFK